MYTYLCLCVWVFAGSKVLAEKWVFARMLLFYGLIWHYRMLSSIGCYSNRSCLKMFRVKSISIFNTQVASNIVWKTFASSRCSVFKLEFDMRKYKGYSFLRHNVVWRQLQTHTYMGYIFKRRSLINTPSAILKRSSVRFKIIWGENFVTNNYILLSIVFSYYMD